MSSSGLSWSDLWTARELFAAPIGCAAMAGLVLGFLSVFVVLRRMVFVSAAASQCAGLGVALAFWIEIFLGIHLPPVALATLMTLSATLLLAVEPRALGVSREALLGLVYALSASLAVLIGTRIAQEAHDVQAILFGTAVMVRPLDLALVGGVGATILLLGAWFRRAVFFAAFDAQAAAAQGVPVAWLNAALLMALGAMIGVSARALGALPIFALSTLPALAALQMRCSLGATFLWSALFGMASGVAGYLVAFFWDLPVGAAQAGIAATGAIASMAARGFSKALAWRQRGMPSSAR